MTKTDTITFRVEPALRLMLDRIQEADGITVGEQLRRAAKLWVERHEQRQAADAKPRRKGAAR